MAKTYTAKLLMDVKAVEQITGDLASSQWPHPVKVDLSLAAGTAVSEVAMAWSQTIALGVGNVSHELDASSITPR